MVFEGMVVEEREAVRTDEKVDLDYNKCRLIRRLHQELYEALRHKQCTLVPTWTTASLKTRTAHYGISFSLPSL